MLPVERELIEAPLQRMMKRLDPAITGAIEKYTDPLLVVMGLITWGARVWQIQLAKLRAARQAQQAARETEAQQVTPIESAPLPVYDAPAPGVDVLEPVMP